MDSIPIFYALSYNVFLASMGMIPNLILQSSIVNRQRITLIYYSLGLLLNVFLDLLVIRLGYGVAEVAWVTVCTQGLVTFALYRSINNYISRDRRELWGFQARILFPFLLVTPFYFFHLYLNSVTTNVWMFAGLSLIAQIILWSFVISVFYQGYLSIGKIKTMMKSLKHVEAN